MGHMLARRKVKTRRVSVTVDDRTYTGIRRLVELRHVSESWMCCTILREYVEKFITSRER